MFSNEPRCQYERNQLADVICQLRFPDILVIDANQPAEFQDAIRSDFPQFAKFLKKTSAKTNPQVATLQENAQATANYQFASADGVWRVNLTSQFISLACSHYTNWESFARRLDAPLAAFIKIYKPAYFYRIGLRYINFISRKQLGLEDTPFSQLIQQPYLGILGDEEVAELHTSRCSMDAETEIRGGCRLKVHAGPGIVKQNGQTDNEVKFIFDQDLFITGNIPINYSAGALETLHSQAYPIFRDAIVDTLHDAMEPIPLK